MSQEYSRPYIQNPQPLLKEQVWKTWRNGSQWKDAGSSPGPTSNTTYFYHIGQSAYSATGCTILTTVQSVGTSVSQASIGIFKGFFPLTLTSSFSYTSPFEDLPSLTRLGVAGFTAALGTTTGVKIVECSFTAGVCDPEDELWLAIGFSANSIPGMMTGIPDVMQSGRFLTVSGSLPATLTAAGPSNLSWGSTGTFLLDFSVMLYGQ